MNKIAALMSAALEREVAPGQSAARAIVELIVARAVAGDIDAARLAWEIATSTDEDDYDERVASAYDHD
jgi:hypothetical protein